MAHSHASVEATVSAISRSRTLLSSALLSSASREDYLYGFQGGPAGPLVPPTRRARLRSRYGGANAGRLARKAEDSGPPINQKDPGAAAGFDKGTLEMALIG
jgi:hypothetical protein